MSDPLKSIRSLLVPDSLPKAPHEESDGSNPAAETLNNSPDYLDTIRHFFDEIKFDPYEKNSLRPDSYRVAGEPCHGGYAHEHTKLNDESEDPKE